MPRLKRNWRNTAPRRPGTPCRSPEMAGTGLLLPGGKNIQMITERCGDPEYWDKLDRNDETGINLGKLSPSELRALRRDMQMIFPRPGCQP